MKVLIKRRDEMMGEILKDGDILVFKAGNHWLSKSIALLTGSDVSHVAMVYDSGNIVEMELPGIQLTPFAAMEGDTAYLMRLEPELDSRPLIKAAQVYIDAKTKYDIPALIMLGGLLIYRPIRPTPEFVMIADLILRAAVKVADKLIQAVILDNPDKAMVCSQLVYQIYDDCNKEYHIQLDHAVLQTGIDGETQQNGTLRLIERIENESVSCENPFHDSMDDVLDEALGSGDTEPDQEELARRLCETIMGQENAGASSENSMEEVGALLNPARTLIEKLEKFLELCRYEIPLDALFVAPADFVYHTKNLRQIQTIKILKG